jgi:DNA-binding NtrC family response regulator
MLPNSFIEPDVARHQVLLVEDEAIVRALLAEELRSTGFKVVEAANADEAWAFLQAGGKADLVFSDVTMPGSMNGVELIRKVKRFYPSMEAIITSGNPGPVSISDICTFLQKPYRLADAARTVMRCLAARSLNEGGWE